MFDVTHRIDGVDALTVVMSEVSSEIRYKGGRAALRKAANLVADVVKQNAQRLDDPNTSEKISENVAVRWSTRRFKRTGDLMFRVGLLGGARTSTPPRKRRAGQRSLAELGELAGKGKKNPGGDTWYWRLLEFGTRKFQARPFMRPALERNTQAATVEFVQQARKAIERAVKKAAKVKP